jgi:DNA-binding NtrC family response regulator
MREVIMTSIDNKRDITGSYEMERKNIDGIKILKKIREFYSGLPVIIISASVELDVIKQAYEFGCNDFLKKPFFIDELEIKIERYCNIQNDKIFFMMSLQFMKVMKELLLKTLVKIKDI